MCNSDTAIGLGTAARWRMTALERALQRKKDHVQQMPQPKAQESLRAQVADGGTPHTDGALHRCADCRGHSSTVRLLFHLSACSLLAAAHAARLWDRLTMQVRLRCATRRTCDSAERPPRCCHTRAHTATSLSQQQSAHMLVAAFMCMASACSILLCTALT